MADDETDFNDYEEDEGTDDDDFDFDNEDETEAEAEPDDEDKESKLEEDDDSIGLEDDDELTDFQKLLVINQKQEFKTPNRMTKYELAALIGFRAQQIAEGAQPYVEVGQLTDPSEIALKELNEGKLPFIIERPLPSSKIGKFTYEIRTLNELINVNSIL